MIIFISDQLGIGSKKVNDKGILAMRQ